MKAFICVYRHSRPKRSEWLNTTSVAGHDPLLREFLDHYNDADCYYDWGDDPAFFAATKLLGDPRAASWGVCRRTVRSQLEKGDVVIWFNAKEDADRGSWQYYFIGFSTVAHPISREQLWQHAAFADYRRFYNVLAKFDAGRLRQSETFHSFHDDWVKRAAAPYVILNPNKSQLNLRHPLHVADKPPNSRVELWRSDRDERVRGLERALFDQFNITRRLRTTHPQIAHPHIAIHKHIKDGPADALKMLTHLRHQLSGFVE